MIHKWSPKLKFLCDVSYAQKKPIFAWNNTDNDYFCLNISKASSPNRFSFFFQTLPVDDMRIWRKNKIHKMNILISSNSNGGDSTNVLQHRQISSTTRPNTIMRTPDHYEMIDQIGKGEKFTLKKLFQTFQSQRLRQYMTR